MSAYKGLLSATISGNLKRYVIKKQIAGSYQLHHVKLQSFPKHSERDFEELINSEASDRQSTNTETPYTSHLKSFNYEDNNRTNSRDLINPNIVDMLIVYNDAARIESGGSPSNPDDTLNIEQEIIAEMDSLNTSLENSQAITRVTKFHVAKINGFQHGLNGGIGLRNFRILPAVNNLRNQVGADTVMGILETDWTHFGFCGLSYPHTNNSDGLWSIGAGFSEYAYSIVVKHCISLDNSFTHEFGHVMGTNHERFEHTTNWVNEVINNGFPKAFAWSDGVFYSVGSYNGFTSRRLYFSNPNISVDGHVTGVIGTADNVSVIDDMVAFTTNYRTRPDLIFFNGFE